MSRVSTHPEKITRLLENIIGKLPLVNSALLMSMPAMKCQALLHRVGIVTRPDSNVIAIRAIVGIFCSTHGTFGAEIKTDLIIVETNGARDTIFRAFLSISGGSVGTNIG